MFQVSVLGPIEVSRDGHIVPVPAGKTSELLVRLALEAGLFVRADRLVDDLWAAGAVNTRRNTLQSKIAKLRRAFGDPAVIVSGDGGYKLAVARSEVDALAVLRDAATAARLLDAGDDGGAAGLCASTLAMYRGAPTFAPPTRCWPGSSTTGPPSTPGAGWRSCRRFPPLRITRVTP